MNVLQRVSTSVSLPLYGIGYTFSRVQQLIFNNKDIHLASFAFAQRVSHYDPNKAFLFKLCPE